MRNRMVMVAVMALVAGGLLAAIPPSADSTGKVQEYVVQYREGVSAAEARAEIDALGGRVVEEISAIGAAKVLTSNPDFASDAIDSDALAGVARNRIVGFADPALREEGDEGEPLADRQWGMKMIGATAEGSYAVETGDPDVLVGIIDTGIDSTHPDLDDNFNAELSRNFTTDIPLIDGPCNQEPDHSCEDPADVDEGGHGTHVAGIVGAELNGLGVAGVAPTVSLVNLRAGQDSGYFFLFETLEAHVYAAANGIDVVNMSFFTDPWWANCRNHPDDSLEEQIEQRSVIDLSNAAL